MKKGIGCCAGIVLLMLLLGALLLLVALPAAIEYIASLDVEIIFDLQMGEQYSFGDWNLVVTTIHDTSADFAVVETGETFNLAANDMATLPGGYVVRLVAIQGNIVRVQLFAPIVEG
jgi:hypothetical protein